MKPIGIRTATLVLLAALAGAASAQLSSMLEGTPGELFTQKDTDLMLDAVQRTLDAAPENEPVAWANAQTNHRGDVTLVRSFESRGRPCKELRVRNQAGMRSGESTVNWCQVDGKWRLLSSSQLK